MFPRRADYHAVRQAGELSERDCCASVRGGEVPEWSIGAVSKAVVLLAGTVGSNPTLSASRSRRKSPQPCPKRPAGRLPHGAAPIASLAGFSPAPDRSIAAKPLTYQYLVL